MDLAKRCIDLAKRSEIAIKCLKWFEEKPPSVLLNMAKELYENMVEFEKSCKFAYNYKATLGNYYLALLKIKIALERDPGSIKVEDELAKYILKMFTQNEIQLLVKFDELCNIDELTTDQLVMHICLDHESITNLVAKLTEETKVLSSLITSKDVSGPLLYAVKDVHDKRQKKIARVMEELARKDSSCLLSILKGVSKATKTSYVIEQIDSSTIKIADLLSRLESLERRMGEIIERVQKLGFDVVRPFVFEDELKRLREEYSKVQGDIDALRQEYKMLIDKFDGHKREFEQLKLKASEVEKELSELENNYGAVKEIANQLREEQKKLRMAISKFESKYSELETKIELLKDKISDLEQAKIEGSIGNVVKKEDVDYYYQVIRGRAESILTRVKIYNPRSSGHQEISEWDSIEEYHEDSSDGRLNLRGVRFIKSKGFLKKQVEVIIDYVIVTHFTKDYKRGEDFRPLGRGDISYLLNRASKVVAKEGSYYILVVVSLTGFSEELLRDIKGDVKDSSLLRRSPVSTSVTLYLVDLLKGTLYYNEMDPVAKENSFVASLELPEEQVNRIKEYLRSEEARNRASKRSPYAPFLTLEEISNELRVPESLVQRAIRELEKENLGKLVLVKLPIRKQIFTVYKYKV